MTTRRTLLNLDYYRNILADDPYDFMTAVSDNNFVDAICEETQVLINEIVKRRNAVDDEDYRVLLTAKLYLAMGMPERVTDEMKSRFPSLEVPTAEKQEELSKNWNKLGHVGEFEQVSNMCRLMREHARLVDLIEETSSLNTAWDVINPNQFPTLTHHDPVLASYESPASTNNINL